MQGVEDSADQRALGNLLAVNAAENARNKKRKEGGVYRALTRESSLSIPSYTDSYVMPHFWLVFSPLITTREKQEGYIY